MERRITYITFDGSEFKTEEEATAYEDFINLTDSVSFYDENFKPMIINVDSLNDFKPNYIKIQDKNGLNKLKQIFKYCGYVACPNTVGNFFYDENTDTWVNIEKWHQEHECKYQNLMNNLK